MQHAQMPAVRPKRSLVTTFFVAVLGLFCVVCVLKSDGITAEWGPLQVGYALAARPFSTVAARSSTPEMVSKAKIANKNVWTTFIKASEVPEGTVASGFRFGQEIAIANQGGTLYALANKLPPTGQPATFGALERGGIIVEPITGQKFNMKTGKAVDNPKGTFAKIISGLSKAAGGNVDSVPVYPVRKGVGGNVEVLINVNAKAQFEQSYWRGVLDAQGKVDGGYY